jgi:hypothetical protein
VIGLFAFQALNCLFVCGLFNDAVSTSYCIAFKTGLLMKNEWEGMSKDACMAYFKVLHQNLPGETGENHETLLGEPVIGLRCEPGISRIRSKNANQWSATFACEDLIWYGECLDWKGTKEERK